MVGFPGAIEKANGLALKRPVSAVQYHSGGAPNPKWICLNRGQCSRCVDSSLIIGAARDGPLELMYKN
jgi:hypothetical protein